MNQISQEKPKQVLFSIINSLLDNRDEFLVNPQSDFTRSKKITFSQTILFPMIVIVYLQFEPYSVAKNLYPFSKGSHSRCQSFDTKVSCASPTRPEV